MAHSSSSFCHGSHHDAFCYTFTQTLLPILTTALTILLCIIPTPAIWSIWKSESRSLGSFNPLPMPFLSNLCLAGILYGFFLKDYVLVLANIVGFLCALIFTLVLFAANGITRRQQFIMLGVLFTGTLACLTSALISFIPLHSHPDKFRAGAPLGIIFVLCLVAFYASPLSTIVTAFKTRDSSSFYRPLVVMSVLSSLSWVFYGFVLMEWFIIVPNSLAACCAIGQAAACMILPIRNHNLDPFLAEEGAIVIKEDDKATKCKV